MADDDGPLDIQPLQYAMHKMRLGGSGPDPPPRSIRMAEAGPVNGDDPVAFRKLVNEAADHEVLSHRAVAMDQNHGTALAPGDVVDPHPIHLDKPAAAWRRVCSALMAFTAFVDARTALLVCWTALFPCRTAARVALARGLQGLGGLLGHETGSAPGGLPKQA